MDKLKTHYRSESGQIIVVLIILLGLIGGGVWWLYSSRDAMAKEGREFGREAIQRIVVQRDVNFFLISAKPGGSSEFSAVGTAGVFRRHREVWGASWPSRR